MNDEKKYPIAEIFTSPQGEGVWTGTMMTFIRLAGCTVGKPYPKEDYQPREEQTFVGLEDMPPKFPIYTEECTLYDGRKFACDTDYRVKERLTIEEIMARVPKEIKHICISGGEPMMHHLDAFYYKAEDGVLIHVETSGTIPYEGAFGWGVGESEDDEIWITVSPKFGCLPEMIVRADEIKLLVDEKFDPINVPIALFEHDTVYLQPVNGEHTVNADNVKRCMEWQKKFPQWRVSLQLHKVLEHFVEERVR